MTKITELPDAALPLNAADYIEVVQNLSGSFINKKAPISEVGGSSGGGSDAYFDQAPAVADALDDEFNSGPAIDAKWTAYGGGAIVGSSVHSDRPDNLYVSTNTSSEISGWYQTLPATTGVYRLAISDHTFRVNYSRGGGIVLLPAGAISASSPVVYHGLLYNGDWTISAVRHSALATWAADIGKITSGRAGKVWLEVELHSATSVSFRYSFGGGLMTLLSGPYTVPFTVDKVGIGLSGEGGAHEVMFDWFRRIS